MSEFIQVKDIDGGICLVNVGDISRILCRPDGMYDIITISDPQHIFVSASNIAGMANAFLACNVDHQNNRENVTTKQVYVEIDRQLASSKNDDLRWGDIRASLFLLLVKDSYAGFLNEDLPVEEALEK